MSETVILNCREWFSKFKIDCPDGQLGKDKMVQIFNLNLPDDEADAFVYQMFRIFDKDGNGEIDFREFMMATDLTQASTPQAKLRWAFKVSCCSH
jgi:Ca2+-binding EF-hand superfamily protein